MSVIHVLSGGAAQGLVTALAPRFLAESGSEVCGTFGAVGAMKERLLAGEPCDVLILTDALIGQLAARGHVVHGSEHPIGVVKTGIAVRTGDPDPRVDSAEALQATLVAARGIYFPDPVKATAGIHFMSVLQKLGIAQDVAERLHAFPNGATAMRALSEAKGPGLIGCTQVTEILYTPGVRLVSLLPREFELATTYTAAMPPTATSPREAEMLVRMLVGDDASQTRRASGFE